MRKVREFTDPTDARTARQLTRQLGELEDNVAAEAAEIREAFLPHLEPVETATTESGLRIGPGQSVGVDTTAGNLDVVLEPPSAKNRGDLAAVFKRVAANTVTLRPDGDALINGATSLAVTAVGLRLIMSDGEAYWA